MQKAQMESTISAFWEEACSSEHFSTQRERMGGCGSGISVHCSRFSLITLEAFHFFSAPQFPHL